MSRPLIATAPPFRKRRPPPAAVVFHRRVFKRWGGKCLRPECGLRASDAAHIVPRSKLGQHRYACPEENGRPLCRRDHDAQERGEWDFSAADYAAAIQALNKVLKVPLSAALLEGNL